jgi:PAS domain S-box-containing protein
MNRNARRDNGGTTLLQHALQHTAHDYLQSETRFRTLFDAAPIGISINDATGRYVQVNPWLCDKLGYAEEGMQAITCIDLTYRDDLAETSRCFSELVAGTRDTFALEKRYVCKDGHLLWTNMACAAVRDADGKFLYAFAMLLDTTERKLEEQALHNLVAGTASVTGQEFFPELVKHLAAALNVRYALVSECVNGPNRVRSLAYWKDDAWQSAIEYDTIDTTCEEVLKQGRMCFYPDHVQERFPKETALVDMRAVCYLGAPLFDRRGRTIGHMFVINDAPLENPERAKSILAIFAARAATELQRKQMEESLRNLVAGTASVTGEEFFPALVKHLGIALGVRQAVVAECLDARAEHARALAVWRDDAWVPGFDYALANTPCYVLHQSRDVCYYPDHVQEHFPGNTALPSLNAESYMGVPLFDSSGNSIGHLYVVDTKPLVEEEYARSIMGIFAARAAMELQRKKSEAQIREQAMFLDKAHDAILVQAMDDRIVYWNQAAEELYGWTKEEAIGKNEFDLLFDTGDFHEHHNAHEKTLAAEDWNGELHQKTKSGREITVESRWTLMKNDSGAPKAILVMNIDITEKKKLEAQFLRAQRMESIGTLAGGIAHDLNNVLTPIMLAAETLQDRPMDDRTQSLVEMIHLNARRGADMANQVLAFARGVEGRRVAIDPKHLVREIEKIVKETFPRNIQVMTKVARGTHAVSADPTQIHQVLLNLALNARDAMPHGGTLRLTTENVELDEHYCRMHPESKPGIYVVISVTDSGTGIAESDIPKIFEPFFTTKEIGKGTGLGLSTVSGIVKSHGGFINVYSEIGKGTTFKVHIPALILSDALSSEERHELPKGHGELILIVDDEMSIRDITKTSLESNGYNVIVAGDGTEALSLYAEQKEDVKAVLTDMMMPFMDGAATIRALRKMNPHVKIIAASGLASNEGAADGVKADLFLTKPYTAEKLLKALEKVLR